MAGGRDFRDTDAKNHNKTKAATKGMQNTIRHKNKIRIPKRVRQIISIVSIGTLAGLVAVGCQAHAEKTNINEMIKARNNYIEKLSKDHPNLQGELAKYKATIDEHMQDIISSKKIQDNNQLQTTIKTEFDGVVARAVENFDLENSLKDTLSGEKLIPTSELEKQIDSSLQNEKVNLENSIYTEKADGQKYISLNEDSFATEVKFNGK